MMTITIREDITLTATRSTIDTYLREVREIEREREVLEWLASHTPADPLYSDIYKNVYGVRPRWLY